MMKKQNSAVLLTAGVLAGMLIGTPTVQAAAAYLKATPSSNTIYVDGRRVSLEAYNINGNNYVKLRDIGAAVDINVYWDGSAVQVDTGTSYTGNAPAAKEAAPAVQAPQAPVSIPQSGQSIEAIRQEIVARTNAVRTANGQKALPTDALLMQAAQVRAEEMAATYTYSHTRPDGSSRLTTTDCPYATENIHRLWESALQYKGIGLAELCVSDWTSSPEHFKNMTQDNRCAIGVGVAKGLDSFGQECWYCVQWFLRDGYTITWVDTPKLP